MAEDKKLILPFDDYASIGGDEELEKIKQDFEDEVKKTLEDGLKVADEINGDEHVKAFPVEPKNEKLILKEPETNLNESLSSYDYEAFKSDIYKAISDVCFLYREDGLNQSDIEKALEWFELHFYDNDEVDEDLDEALPGDLGNAYRKARATVGNGYSNTNGYMGIANKQGVSNFRRTPIDFYNSEYTEITPEQALELKKQGRAEDVRVIFDGQLVTFDKDGKQRTGKYAANFRRYNSDPGTAAKYMKKNGDILDSTRKLTFAEVVDRADKIYLANEVNVDPQLRADRQANPESGQYTGDTPRYDLIGNNTNRAGHLNRSLLKNYAGWDTTKDALNRLHQAQKNYEDAILRGVNDEELGFYKNKLKDAEAWYRAKRGVERSNKAARRYLSSELNFKEVYERFNQLKDNVDTSRKQVARAKQTYDDLKANGSPDIARYKNRLASYYEDLRNIMRQIAEYEVKIEDEENMSGEKLQSAADELTRLESELNNLQDQLKDFIAVGRKQKG